ncbi:T9SS-dependent choice-of-anchor J family protein [Hymenobacter sp. GOD-10R]|uniref:T9SS-dependent choice-of-anchor J family protein n=1 Tax=Hymenobacter sp. GOD-10R TaxID=3093922 RepID=UPI002D77A797|nr:T9SS type A sorting domain-containing protein [Hymenobacter sp. GOD-10R]WRQ28065.1 T9SS type A sorting domain-containing protein [Hymenobacter sp. GOD-10R]
MKQFYIWKSLQSYWKQVALAAACSVGLGTAQAQDASVLTIHTLGKLATPSSLPHAVAAAVRNTGTSALTNQSVTLTVTGANTFTSTKTISTLAAGATSLVTFDPYPAALALGTNTVTVSVPADANNTNNTQTYEQQVTTTRVTQIDVTKPYVVTGVGVSSTAPGGALATKFTTSLPVTLNEAKITFVNAGTAGTLYQVQVFDAAGAGSTPGTALYTSPTQTRPTIAGTTGQLSTATVSLPSVAVTGSYYLAIREVGTASGGPANVGVAYQLEDPLRASTSFYQIAAGGAWTDVGTTTLRTRLALEVTIGGAVTCGYPTNVAVSNLTTTSATVAFTGPSGVTSFSLIYGPYGFNPATGGTVLPATASPVTISGLAPGTRYQVYVRSNCGGTAGQSVLSDQATFSTLATCLPPTAVTIGSITGTTATVTLTGPTNGSGFTYWVVPRGAPAPTTGGTTVAGSPISLTGLASSTNYDFYVRANCGSTDRSTLVGPIAFSTSCVNPVVTAPYLENFDAVAVNTLPCGITVADINADARTWAVTADATGSAPNAMRYTYSSNNPADDWFFTPPIAMQAGRRYQLQFRYRAQSATFPEGLEVKFGATTTPAGQTTTIFSNTNIINSTYVTATSGQAAGQVAPIVAPTSGNYYIGFHAISAVDQFYLWVDDVSISQVLATNSPEFDRAISVYPNPSSGVFMLDAHATNSKGAMQVEVTNLLGQLVHTASLVNNRDQQPVDLSKLAAGIYHMKVKSGDEYTMRKLVIE